MKLVLDTNVIVAAFATRGLCADIFRFAIECCSIFGSPELLKECERVLLTKVKVPKKRIKAINSYLKSQLLIIDPEMVDVDACRDKSDLHILGVAKKGKVNFIVTGDQDLLSLKKFGKTKIFTPREFWGYVQNLKQV